MDDQCKLQEPERVRSRIRGNMGPDRSALPLFHKLGMLTPEQLSMTHQSVLFLLNGLPRGHNDIHDSSDYKIAQVCGLKHYFPQSYQQILLQVADESSEALDEWDYHTYRYHGFERFLSPFAPEHFRARIACLPPGEVLDWHIDTNTSYACRAMMLLSGEHMFSVNKKGVLHEQIMKAGEVWFCNTGYNHRVEVLGDDPRIAILFSCHYKSIENLMPCLN